MEYSTIDSTASFLKYLKGIYTPSRTKPEILELPPMSFLMIDGKGIPKSAAFQDAVQALYTLLFQMKMGMKFGKIRRPEGWFDFKVPPLEGLWWTREDVWKATQTFSPEDLVSGSWTLMMLMPPFIDITTFKEGKKQAIVKKPSLPVANIRLAQFSEGYVVQILHVGTYASEPETVRKLVTFAQDHDRRFTGKHHEIYLSDPRRTSPEKLRTIIRYPLRGI